MTAAYYIAKQGHDVTVFEALPKAGGMLRYGIPEYNIPRDILEYETNAILKLGIAVRFNQRWGRDFTLQERLLTQFRVVIFYISLVVLPYPSRLTLEHDFALSYSLLDPFTTLLSLFALLLFILAAIFSARRERIFSFCILWFFGNLFIESSFIPLEIIFEHRTYLPSMMLIFLFIIIRYNKTFSIHPIFDLQ